MTEVQNNRIYSLYCLAEEAGVDKSEIDDLAEQEVRAEDFYSRNPIVPTIGCEVEVSWASLHPDLMNEYFSDLDPSKVFRTFREMVDELPQNRADDFLKIKSERDKECDERYKRTVEIGIPRGKDHYWEFANSPTYSWQLLSKEVDLLMGIGYIPEGKAHAMHITLGGLSVKGGGPQLILPGLELLGVSADRIIKASEHPTYTWARRGSKMGGVRGRTATSLGMGHELATEFRTLATEKPEDHQKLLRASQMMGSILLSRRKGRSGCALNVEVGKMWSEYTSVLMDLWDARGLPRGDEWGSPNANPEIWQAWGECIKARDEPGSLEGQTISRIATIITAAEALIDESKIGAILNK